MNIFIITFIMKFFDCALNTAKTFFLIKNKIFLSSVANSLSAALFIFVADIMANAPADDKLIIIFIVFMANFIGGYFPPKILDHLEADSLFIYNITNNDSHEIRRLADDLTLHNIPASTYPAYVKVNGKVCETLTCKVYATSKQDSKIVDKYLELGNFKYHVIRAI